MANNDQSQYRGKRALILTRVSTAKQEEKYSHAAQERQVREKLIAPLGLRIVDEVKHIIHDTYSGLDYRYRKALEDVLEMAERQEFDVLCMDVLDRGLGRKALAREMFRMQLREFGIQILTTEPSDHADDDSLEGQIMRFIKGYKAEEEVNDFVRRTRNGRREKALGNAEKGTLGQIVGNGSRRYGYEFVHDEKGTRISYKLRFDIVHTDETGEEWTEVKVVIFIFESAANGASTHEIVRLLNKKGIPTPAMSKGMRNKRMKAEPAWQHTSVHRILSDTSYYGEFRQFRRATVRIPGQKLPRYRKTSEEEQVIIAIPAIVTKELWDKANRRVSFNKQLATRNNQTSKESLLRGGFAKCAYCGIACRVQRIVRPRASGEKVYYFHYACTQPHIRKGRCPGGSMSVDELDAAVVRKIVEIIRDPSEVDQKIAKLLADNPVSKQQQQKLNVLNKILREQETMRKNLASEMRKKTLSERTVAFLNTELSTLERQEDEARRDLADQQKIQLEREDLDRRIAAFHQQCQEWREKLDDPEFSPSFAFLSEARLFFGITATVWKAGTEPRHELHTDPPEIMELLSWRAWLKTRPGAYLFISKD